MSIKTSTYWYMDHEHPGNLIGPDPTWTQQRSDATVKAHDSEGLSHVAHFLGSGSRQPSNRNGIHVAGEPADIENQGHPAVSSVIELLNCAQTSMVGQKLKMTDAGSAPLACPALQFRWYPTAAANKINDKTKASTKVTAVESTLKVVLLAGMASPR
jgi:hypothetical protein